MSLRYLKSRSVNVRRLGPSSETTAPGKIGDSRLPWEEAATPSTFLALWERLLILFTASYLMSRSFSLDRTNRWYEQDRGRLAARLNLTKSPCVTDVVDDLGPEVCSAPQRLVQLFHAKLRSCIVLSSSELLYFNCTSRAVL